MVVLNMQIRFDLGGPQTEKPATTAERSRQSLMKVVAMTDGHEQKRAAVRRGPFQRPSVSQERLIVSCARPTPPGALAHSVFG